MKKKVLTVCLVAVIAIMAVAGASLAYLTDTDAEDNVFTVGNVTIDLIEQERGENGPARISRKIRSCSPSSVPRRAIRINTVSLLPKTMWTRWSPFKTPVVKMHTSAPTSPFPPRLGDGYETFNASMNVLALQFRQQSC